MAISRGRAMTHIRITALVGAIALIATPSSLRADSTVYSDSLSNTWQNWSWSTTVNFNNSSPVNGGTRSMAVTYNVAWAGLYLHSNAVLNASDYVTLRFAIHGGSAGGQSIRVVG